MLIDALIRMYLGWRNVGIFAANNLSIPACWILGMTHIWWVMISSKRRIIDSFKRASKGSSLKLKVWDLHDPYQTKSFISNHSEWFIPGKPQSFNWSVKCQKWTFRGLTEIYSRLPFLSVGISSSLWLHHLSCLCTSNFCQFFIRTLEIINLKNPNNHENQKNHLKR